MPAPWNKALLPLIVQPLSVAVPALNSPPPYWDEFPLIVQPLSSTEPELSTPPPPF